MNQRDENFARGMQNQVRSAEYYDGMRNMNNTWPEKRFREVDHDDMEMDWAIYVLSTTGVVALLASGAWFLYTVADWLAS